MFASNKSAAPSSSKLFVEDVFSTYLYTGNGSTQTITNGIDLAGKGGMVWIKWRTNASSHLLYDTARGATKSIYSNSNYFQETFANSLTSFNSNGFSLGLDANANPNGNTNPYASWTFRKASKFFDVVTYTGTGTATTIAHNLGIAPGCIIVKRTDTTSNWAVYHRGNTSAAYYEKLNLTDAQASDSTVWNSTDPTSSVFSVGTSALTNASGGTYVAYLFAHDTSSTGIIQCGSYVGTGADLTVTLGWEPQFLITKAAVGATSDWAMFDNMRGMAVGGITSRLNSNATAAEYNAGSYIDPTATGFVAHPSGVGNTSGVTYIYIAIRRGPMRTPTSGTSVFNAKTRTAAFGGTGSITAGFTMDALFSSGRVQPNLDKWMIFDRLRGGSLAIRSNTNVAEADWLNAVTGMGMDGYSYGVDNQAGLFNGSYSGATYVDHFFKRAPSFFDIVRYSGNGTSQNISHNLGVAPELIIVKELKDTTNTWNWAVYASPISAGNYLVLNSTLASTASTVYWNNTSPTSSVFSVGASAYTNFSGGTYISYLFASCPGVSKIGSYTGNGSSQTINCGFAAGARFVLIKRTDSADGWYVWDTARGITATSDPHIAINSSTTNEVTGIDSISPQSTGFGVVQNTTTNINVNAANYIYLAIA